MRSLFVYPKLGKAVYTDCTKFIHFLEFVRFYPQLSTETAKLFHIRKAEKPTYTQNYPHYAQNPESVKK